MSLEQDDLFLSERDTLERVDEYSLYCHYLGYEPQFGIVYRSPIRAAEDLDERPSFSIFPSKYRNDVEYMWKDHGRGITGDIFDLVRWLYQLRTRTQGLEKVQGDFGLGPQIHGQARVILHEAPPRLKFRIRIKSRPLVDHDVRYWGQFNVDPWLLQQYNVTAIRLYWTYEEQEAPRFPRTPGYAYRIWDHYKLYFPHEPKDFKFRNDFDERHLEGFCQLRFNSDLLVITKAMKDVMMLRSFGIEAVAVRGEHTMVEPKFMELFQDRYKHIVVLMDNDGKHKGPEYTRLYGIPLITIPSYTGEKDGSDYCRVYGPDAAEALITQLIYDKIGTRSFIRSYLPR